MSNGATQIFAKQGFAGFYFGLPAMLAQANAIVSTCMKDACETSISLTNRRAQKCFDFLRPSTQLVLTVDHCFH